MWSPSSEFRLWKGRENMREHLVDSALSQWVSSSVLTLPQIEIIEYV